MVISGDTQKEVADAIATLLAGCKIKLSKHDVTPSPSSVLTDFVVATFGGYSDVTSATILTLRDDVTGNWVLVLNAVPAFSADNTISASQEVFALFVTNAAGTVLYGSMRLDNPYTFVSDGDGLILDTVVFQVPVDALR
jgi:hypothetical protein